MIKISIFILLLATSSVVLSEKLWPRPQSVTQSQDGRQTWVLDNSSAPISYVITENGSQKPVPDYISEILSYYNQIIFNKDSSKNTNNKDAIKTQIQLLLNSDSQIKSSDSKQYVLNIDIKNWDLQAVYDAEDEKYTLNLSQQYNWKLTTSTYFGFLRGLETLSQLITNSSDDEQNEKPDDKNEFVIKDGGITIEDSPDYMHRGMMLDTSRWFLQIDSLKKFLNAMMFNKMNVLHLHITDDPSFPLDIQAYPNLSKDGSFTESEQYSQENIESLIQFGLTRGVRIIPEIDSPTNTYSWSLNEELKDINILCNSPNYGQLNPTLDQTYDAVQTIFTQINTQFQDEFVHFGGQLASSACYDKVPEIKTYMTQNNIQSYLQLQQNYRKKQKSIWTDDIKSKKNSIIYWADTTNLSLGFDSTDIIQWVGTSGELQSSLNNFENKVIISSGDIVTFDKGFGTYTGQTNPLYTTWMEVYNGIQLGSQLGPDFKPEIIGAEALLWGELNTDQTLMSKSWIRGSSVGERTWNSQANENQPNSIDMVTRLQAQYHRMTARGIPCSPISTEYCTRHVELCFYNH